MEARHESQGRNDISRDLTIWQAVRIMLQRHISGLPVIDQKGGTRGLADIKKAGGIAMVQSPDEAAYPEMPRNAIRYDRPVDLIAPISGLAAKIIRLTGASASRRVASSR